MFEVILPLFSHVFMVESSRDICDVNAPCIFLQKVIIQYALHDYNYG